MTGRELAQLRLRKLQWYAWSDFADHVLEGETYWDNGRGARWVVRSPGTFVYYAEIIAGAGGSLVVHGDIDLVRFACYSDRSDAWSRLRWMAHRTDVDYYVAQKARIGGARQWRSHTFDSDIVRAYLKDAETEVVHQRRRHELEADEARKQVEALREAADRADDGEHEVMSALWEAGLYEINAGTDAVLCPSVIYAHAALNRCASLLWEKYGYEGPPEVRT